MAECNIDFVANAFVAVNKAIRLKQEEKERLTEAVNILKDFIDNGGTVNDNTKVLKIINKTKELLGSTENIASGLFDSAKSLGFFDLLTAKKAELNLTLNSEPDQPEDIRKRKETIIGGLTQVDPDSEANYLDRIFYGGNGKQVLTLKFRRDLTRKLVADIINGTEAKEEELNKNIAEYMEELFGVIKNYAKKFTPHTFLTDDASTLFTTHGSNLYKIINEFALIEPTMNLNNWTINPSEVNDLYVAYINRYESSKSEIKEKAERFEAMMALISISHFDDLLKDTFGKWILPKDGYHNTPLPEIKRKYEFKLSEGKHLKKYWGDKEETTTAWDLLNDKLRMLLETMPMYRRVGNGWEKTNEYLNKNLIDLYTKTVKGILRKVSGTDRTILVENNTIYIFGNSAEGKLPIETEEFIKKVARFFKGKPFTLGDLISYTRKDTFLGFKAISDVINTFTNDSFELGILKKNIGLSSLEIQNLVSIHKNIFDSSEHAESLWRASKKYYTQISNLFNTSADVEYHQLTIKDGHMTSKRMSPAASSSTIYEILDSINSNLIKGKLASINKIFRPIVDLTDPDKPRVTFFLKGDKSYKITYTFKEEGNEIIKIFKTRRLKNPDSPYDEWQEVNTTDKKAIFSLVKALWGKDLHLRKDIFEALVDSQLSTNYRNAEISALLYLERLFIPIYANAVAFNSIDLGKLEHIDQQQYNKVTDPYSLKVGEVIYRKEDDGLKTVVIIPNDRNIKKYKDSEGLTFFKYSTTHLNKDGEPVTTEHTFYPRELGYRSANLAKVNTIVELNDDIQVMTLAKVKDSMLNGKEYMYKKLSAFNIQKQYGSFGNSVYVKRQIGIVDVFTSKVFPNISALVDAVNLVNKITIKSTMRTGEGTDLAVGGTNSLDAERNVFKVLLGMDNDGRYINPMVDLEIKSRGRNQDGLELNRAWKSIFNGNHISREFAHGASQKLHKDFNLKENFVASFIYNYLTPLYVDNRNKLDILKIDEVIGFINAVISDKTNVPIDEVVKSEVLKLKTVNDTDILTLETLGRAYVNVFTNIETDFRRLTEYVQTHEFDKLPGIEELPSKAFVNLNITTQDDFKSLNNWCETNYLWCRKYRFTPLKLLRFFSEQYNLSHRLDTIDLVEETHYRKADKVSGQKVKDHLEANLAFLQLVKRYSSDFWKKDYEKNYFIQFDDIAFLHFLRKYKDVLKATEARNEWVHESNYANFLKTNLNNFVWALIKNDVQIRLKDLYGEYYKWASGAGWNKDNYKKNAFYDEDMMVLAVIKDSTGKILKKITKRSDMYGYVTDNNEFKVFQDGKNRTYLDPNFDINSGIFIDGKLVTLDVNPELTLFNRRQFYFNQLVNLQKNGSHIWSDAKKDTNSPKEEGGKYFDFNKRNVVNTATNTQFRIGDVDGIPEELNIAVIEDIRALCFGENGDETHIKPYDGMTRVDPFMMYWENSALDDEVTASTKKPIMYAFLEKYLAGFVLKTASFALTNEGMRNSFWDRRMMWKMTNPRWITRQGNGFAFGDNFPIDITKNENGDIYYGGDDNHKETFLYYWIDTREGKKYYRINEISKTKLNNTYKIQVLEVNSKGNVKVIDGKVNKFFITKKIDSNYTFWEALGGYLSLLFDGKAEKLVDSENSIKRVSEIATKVKTVGIRIGSETYYHQLTLDLVNSIKNSTDGKIRVKDVDRKTGVDYYKDETVSMGELRRLKKLVSSEALMKSNSFVSSPLKNSDIHLLATKGAVKKGFANINGTEKYYNNESLNFMRVKAYDYGVQLDAEHEADGSVVSMMTLVISALADRGYTHNMALSVYNALSTLTSTAVQENLGDFTKLFETDDRTNLLHNITSLLVQEFMKSDTRTSNTDIAKAVTSKLVQLGFNGKSLSKQATLDLIPFSDGSVFNHLLSTISSIINKTAIKALMFGTLAVLCPAHNILMLLGDITLSEITSFNRIKSLQEEVKKNKTLTDVSEIQPKRTYEVLYADNSKETFVIKDLADYYNVYDKLKPLSGYKLYEKVYDLSPTEYVQETDATPAEVRANNERIINNIRFGWYNLNLTDGTSVGINVDSSLANALSKYLISQSEIKTIDRVNLYTRNLAPYNVLFKAHETVHNIYDLHSVRKKYETERLIEILRDIAKKDDVTKLYSIPVLAITDYKTNLLESLDNADPLDEDRMTTTKKNYLESIINTRLDLDKNTEEVLNLKSALQLKDGLDNYIQDLKDNIRQYTKDFLYDLYKISQKNQPGTFLDEPLENYEVKLYDGRTVSVGDFTVNAHETLLPRVYARLYGLRPGDKLSNIKDYTFFFRRLLENYKTDANLNNYDVVLKLTNGKHIYLKLNSLDTNQFLVQKQINLGIRGGKLYRRDVFGGKAIHAIASSLDEIWGNTLSNNEIIVVKSKEGNEVENLKFYLDSFSYLSIELSDRLKEDTAVRLKVFDAISLSTNRVAKNFSKDYSEAKTNEYFINKKAFLDNIDKYLNPFNYVEEDDYKKRGATKNEARKALLDKDSIDNKIIKRLVDTANRQYVSFLNSLEYTVARIPAQSMQSFMAMKVVGFVEENVNNCYVCDDLIWLQGSDFDIDKATFMGYAFNDYGVMYTWSPYFSLYTYEHAKASKYLPFPILKAFSVAEGLNLFDYNLLLYNETNNPNGIIVYDETGYHIKDNLTPNQIKTLAKFLNTVNVLSLRVDTVKVKLKEKPDLEFTNLAFYADADHKDLAQALVDIANKHNRANEDGTFYYSKSIEMELKNYVAANAYNISSDPANIPASQTSVDVAADPWKALANISTFGESTNGSRPGDASIYWSALETNQTGKDVIGITAANGVKVYYALTLVINLKLALDNEEDLKKLTFVVNFNGETYRFLADAFVALSKHLDPGIKLAILENELKADLMISGLLSLATDNAKELKLGRLNAGRNIAGLYLYGITIGIPAEELFRKLTSPTAIVLDRLMKSNVLLDDIKFSSLTSAINYIASGPKIIGQSALRGRTKNGTIPIGKKEWLAFRDKTNNYNIREFDEKTTKISEGLLDYTTDLDNNIKFKSLTETLLDYMDSQQNFLNYLKRFSAYKEMVTKAANELAKSDTYKAKMDAAKIKKNLQEIEDFIYIIREIALGSAREGVINKGEIFKDLVDIATLDDGYQEIGSIRALLGLNLGIKTLFAEKLQFYENFSNFINNRAKAISRLKKYYKLIGKDTADLNEKTELIEKFAAENANYVEFAPDILDDNPYKVSFAKYMEDTESGREYKNLVQNLYQNIKQSFNIYTVVDDLPHYREYLKSAYIDYESSSISAKFRTFTNTLVPLINSVYKPNSKTRKTYVKRATWFIENTMINHFLRQLPVLELASDIGEGGREVEFKVLLGTTEGNAAFKEWMESSFIPLLQNNPEYAENTFILDLEASFNNLTLTRNITVAYTLPINMMPRSEFEKDALSRYMVDFNLLNNKKYSVVLPSGKKMDYNIVDLFFYYNLINYRNSINLNSLTPLMLSLLELGSNQKLGEYMRFVSSFDRVNDFKISSIELDKEGSFKISSTDAQNDISFSLDDINRAIAPTEQEMSISEARHKGIPYIRFYNNVSMRYELYLLSKELVDEFNRVKKLRRDIREDSYAENQLEKVKELKAEREYLITVEKHKENDQEVLDLDKRIQRAEARAKRLEIPEEELVEVPDMEEPEREETESEEDYAESEFEPLETPEEMFGEDFGTGLEEADVAELEEALLALHKTWFEQNGYTPVEQNREDITKDTPYISTIGNPVKLTDTTQQISMGRIRSAGVRKVKTESGKTILKVSDIVVHNNGEEVKIGDMDVDNIDNVLGIDIDGDVVVYSHALAVEINPRIERKLKELKKDC